MVFSHLLLSCDIARQHPSSGGEGGPGSVALITSACPDGRVNSAEARSTWPIQIEVLLHVDIHWRSSQCSNVLSQHSLLPSSVVTVAFDLQDCGDPSWITKVIQNSCFSWGLRETFLSAITFPLFKCHSPQLRDSTQNTWVSCEEQASVKDLNTSISTITVVPRPHESKQSNPTQRSMYNSLILS